MCKKPRKGWFKGVDYGLGPSLHGSWFRQTLGGPPPSRGEGFWGDSEVLSLGSQADRRFIVCLKKMEQCVREG